MINDTIREELQSKITIRPRTEAILSSSFEEFPVSQPKPMPVAAVAASSNRAVAVAISPSPSPEQLPKRQITAHLEPAKTSPTLVRFQDPNRSNVPEWRTRLKESVKQRKNGGESVDIADNVARLPVPMSAPTAAALAKSTNIDVSDARLAKAMARIENSRRTFLKNGNHRVVSTPMTRPVPVPARPELPVRTVPKTVSEVAPIIEVKRETNRLPELKPIEAVAKPVEVPVNISRIEVDIDRSELLEHKVIHISAVQPEKDVDAMTEVETEDEIEDLAPFSMRFAAGLFDMILSAVIAAVLLSPLAFYGFDWISLIGLGLFVAAMALVSFVYGTLTMGFFGKTLGLRLFALELVDAFENEYPTMKQAAISSAVYIASLFLLGAGFLAVFFNDENRAAHDLISGTILVKEF
jgi:uncharacterized RDD family membrane protein YckC